MVGKVSATDLERLVFTRLGSADPAVIQGPEYGEDTAAIQMGEETLVVNSDPISLAVDRVGTLGVMVACNDVAASGGTPRWLTNVCILPEDGERTLDRITHQIDEAATELGVQVVGGHAEYSAELSRPLLSMTCIGTTDRYVPTSGATSGDLILLTGEAGIEGTAILASDFHEELDGNVEERVLSNATDLFEKISVLDAASVLASHATAMHDPTEGGVLAGLVELAVSSSVEFAVERGAIPVRPETETLCDAMEVDPLRIFGSGALLATIPEAEREAALAALADNGIPATVIGRVNAAPDDDGCVLLDEETLASPVEDDLYDLWE